MYIFSSEYFGLNFNIENLGLERLLFLNHKQCKEVCIFACMKGNVRRAHCILKINESIPK